MTDRVRTFAGPTQTWQKYCGFLELSLSEWETIQGQLLNEQLQLLTKTAWYRKLLGEKDFGSIDEFRQSVRLTTYDDYADLLGKKREALLPVKPDYWCYAQGPSGEDRWFPYTERAMDRVVDEVIATFILAAARRRGEVRIERGDTALYCVAPKPYLAGYVSYLVRDRLGLKPVPPLEEGDAMEFQQRVTVGFRMGLRMGIDIICCLSSVMLKIGEQFASEAKEGKYLNKRLLHPAAVARLALGRLRSRLASRPLMPSDLWRAKAVVVWGVDTPFYRDQIARYWGVAPYQFYACSEAGVLAMQAWNKKGLTPLPFSAFMEFIPEVEIEKLRDDPEYPARTLLLGQLQPGAKYEVVITSFYGMPLVRYRTGHLIKMLAFSDPETGVRLPQIEQAGRVDEFIDLAGLASLNERVLDEAITSGLENPRALWCARRSFESGAPVVQVYLEADESQDVAKLQERIHQELLRLNIPYQSLPAMLGTNPVRVVLLSPGTVEAFLARVTCEVRTRALAP